VLLFPASVRDEAGYWCVRTGCIAEEKFLSNLTQNPTAVSTGPDRPVLTPLVTFIAPAVWGSTYIVTSEFLPEGRPLLASVLRALPAGLLLILFTRSMLHGHWWWKTLILGILNIGGFFYFLFVAAYLLPGGVAALLGSVQPIVVLVLGYLLLRQRPQPVHFVACAAVIAGMALLVLNSEASLDTAGVLAGLAGAVSMGAGMVLTKKWGRPEGMGNLGFTGWQLAFGGLIITPVMFATEGLPASLTGANIAGYLYLGLIGALVAYALWFRGIERLPTIAVSFLFFGSPLVATFLGLIFRGETLTPAQILGALTIIGSVVAVQLHSHRQSKKSLQLSPQQRVPANT
jgi:probable blue pigment (indigoidine) exporter